MSETIDGSCRCGRVTVRITAPPLLALACHCTGCQKMSASAFSLTVVIPNEGFAVTGGTTVIGGIHGSQGHHHHCDWCKSWMFTTLEPDMGFTNVRTTMLADPARFPPFVETYTSEKLPWATTPATHSFAKFPPMEAFEGFVAEYSKLP